MSDGKKFRIVVGSAEEAVRILKSHFGDKARVLSVKQVEGKGLARFLGSPRLEIIATVEEPQQETKPEAVIVNQTKEDKNHNATNNDSHAQENTNAEYDDGTNCFAPSTPVVTTKQIGNVLKRSGFDSIVVGNFLQDIECRDDKPLTLQESMQSFLENLKKTYEAVPRVPIGKRIAFFGPAASGKTLSLCKLLAKEVFIEKTSPIVMKFASDQPKGEEALSVFCNVLGIKFINELDDDAKSSISDQPVFCDSDGISFNSTEDISSLHNKLTNWSLDTRVLVLNATYEAEFLDHCFAKSSTLGATHFVLTHMDEVISASKLWKYMLNSGLSPLFFTYGQNLTSDFTQNMFSYLLNKSLATV